MIEIPVHMIDTGFVTFMPKPLPFDMHVRKMDERESFATKRFDVIRGALGKGTYAKTTDQDSSKKISTIVKAHKK
jgi:hypothetical protein